MAGRLIAHRLIITVRNNVRNGSGADRRLGVKCGHRTERDYLTGTYIRYVRASDEVRIDISIAILAMMLNGTDSPVPSNNHPVQQTQINALPYLKAL